MSLKIPVQIGDWIGGAPRPKVSAVVAHAVAVDVLAGSMTKDKKRYFAGALCLRESSSTRENSMLTCIATLLRRHRELCRCADNCLVSKSINKGSHMSRSAAIRVNLLRVGAFALQHSVIARLGFV